MRPSARLGRGENGQLHVSLPPFLPLSLLLLVGGGRQLTHAHRALRRLLDRTRPRSTRGCEAGSSADLTRSGVTEALDKIPCWFLRASARGKGVARISYPVCRPFFLAPSKPTTRYSGDGSVVTDSYASADYPIGLGYTHELRHYALPS